MEDLEAEEAEDEDTEIPKERENERSAQETKVSGSAEDLLNRDARGDDPTAEMTPAARNLNETGGTIPERSTIVILGQEEEITTQCGKCGNVVYRQKLCYVARFVAINATILSTDSIFWCPREALFNAN